jgi:anti-anti-sigma factor
MRCRPAATPALSNDLDAGLEIGLETQWRYDIRQVLDHTVVAEVAGEIDLRTGPILRKRLFELTDAGFSSIIIDFDGVRFCDAAGLGVLVAVHNRLRDRGGAISLARVRPAQRRLLEVAGLDRLFAHETLPDRQPGGDQEDNPPTAPTALTG